MIKTGGIVGHGASRGSDDRMIQRSQRSYSHSPGANSSSSSTFVCCLAPPEAQRLLVQFERSAYESYLLGRPTTDHLLTLTKLNVYRAFMSNISALGLTMDWMNSDDTLSPFNTFGPELVEQTSIPPSLRPTQLQRTVPHHPWLDFFPLPQIRDNLLRAGDFFDDEELCVDILGFWDTSGGEKSLIVWGDPWDPYSWEVTEAFVRKWGWVIRGCTEILQSTNRWREKRGERKLFANIP